MLIESSRQGSLPANLQGVWNDMDAAPWSSDYHTNINVQMNYWLAEETNLAEMAQPLVDFANDLRKPEDFRLQNFMESDMTVMRARLI